MDNIRTFKMLRGKDYSGVSGTGYVLDGVLFHTGQVVACWRSSPCSVAVYSSWNDFETIHIKSHPTNDTEIIWNDNG